MLPEVVPVHEAIAPETKFVAAVGHSNFAQYDQYGIKTDEPEFPFSLRYVPTGEINFPSEQTDQSIFDQLKTIEAGSTLY